MTDYQRPGISRLLIAISLILTAVPQLTAASVGAQLSTTEAQSLQREARLVVDLLQNHHFSGRAFREMESKSMVDRFVDELDPHSEFLDAADREFLHRRFDRTLKPVYLFRGDLKPAFEIFDLFITRARERLAWVDRRLIRGFDFSVEETHRDREKAAPFADRDEADRHWESLLKEQVLAGMLRGRDSDEAAAEIRRHYARIGRTIAAYDALAVRERFLDAIIRSFDPHSGYFSADSTREFAVGMEKSVVGVGLNLRKEDGRCVVDSLQRGSPAELSAEIQPGDTITGVAEGDGPWIDLAELRLREIVGLLRGAADTRVRLSYQTEGETTRRETTLLRARVQLGGERAHGAVCMVPAGGNARRVGWIMLPDFYAAGDKSGISSATRDVRELLTAMSARPLVGLVIDLRTNPGGALSEATALSELFLPEGVIMLSRGLDGKVTEHRIKSGSPAYTGPLVVLVSSRSASASEVFAGAMKYHRRALVVGAPATFGKGTVQNYLELAKLPGGQADWGTLRLTRERFYLPDGGSVQLTGVAGDITFPDYDDDEHREAAVTGALPADTLPAPAGLQPAALSGAKLTDFHAGQLGAFAADNLRELPEWALVRRAADMLTGRKQQTDRPLQLHTRQQQWDAETQATLAWVRDHRDLAAAIAYPCEAHETEDEQEILTTEDARLRARETGTGGVLHRLYQGAFVIETTGGRWRKVRLESFDFSRRIAEAETLALRLSTATGRPVETAAMKRFLQQAALLEHITAKRLLKLAAQLPGPDDTQETSRRTLEALLLEITRLDDSLRNERASLDVPLREALRLAARWAETAAP